MTIARLQVFHVDDDDDIREVTAYSLAIDPEIDLRSAASGAEALEALDAGYRPDVILLDVMMPRLDGPATLALIRKRPGHGETPVIFMTARAQTGETDQYRALGALDVIVKPFDPMALARDMRALLARGSMTDPMEAFKARFRDRCAIDLAALERLRKDSVRSGDELRRIAHGLSGSGGTFGFPAVSDAAAPVDDALIEGRPATAAELERLVATLREAIS